MTAEGGANSLVTVPPFVMLQELGDEIVVANLDTGIYFSLNEVAARIWALLQDSESINAVVTEMMDEYDIDEETIRADVMTLLHHFEENGLMKLNNA